MSAENLPVHHNTANHRYEIILDGKTALLEYVRREGIITYTHTETPEELRGRGLAAILTRFALDAARAEGLKVIPQCSYVKAFIAKHVEYTDLLA